MDLNEVTGVVLNRHPWELSRTKCVLAAFSKYMKEMHKDGKGKKYMNVGAGDISFLRCLLFLSCFQTMTSWSKTSEDTAENPLKP